MPADPVVSPADTIRRARNRIAARGQHDLVGLADLADALLAVGERDRRQIARLTEALEGLREYVSPQHWQDIADVLADEEDADNG